MAEYVPVPVEAAAEVADRYRKAVVIILSIDRVFGKIHTTTYGVDAADKLVAADLGPVACRSIGGLPELMTKFEDFRDRTAADWKVERDHLQARIRELRGGPPAPVSEAQVRTAAAAIANARGGRRGAPPITNILEALPAKLREEVLDDARAVLQALRGMEDPPRGE